MLRITLCASPAAEKRRYVLSYCQTVSYVGKANYREAEQYIRDFRSWTSSAASGLTVEISAVNGRFTIDFLQTFSNPVFVNAFLKELEENGIVYDLQDVNELELPNIDLPWTK